MSNTVIKVENLSKQYKLGDIGTGSLSHDINRWWYKVRGKEDPYLQVGESNDRTKKGNSDYVWALKDINFEVKQGEVLGIIGRNGAGKSTLLKILSKTTAPTIGSIKVKGRIASLLEVGTGFHPELSGRENIYLNGAILGMTKREITSKFDEIVDFAGVERYIDTPVKRYSSGMYVRLAFGVAAHLEPEILIVDEVLAVGDAEFQKKCLGKMKDVSVNQGRTVLFVSHNMSAIAGLCNSALILKNGNLHSMGKIDNIISEYLRIGENLAGESEDNSEPNAGQRLKIRKVSIVNTFGNTCSDVNNAERVFVEISFEVLIEDKGYDVSFDISHTSHGIIYCSSLKDTRLDDYDTTILPKGINTFLIELPMYFMREGEYYINASAAIPKIEMLDVFKFQTQFSVIDSVTPLSKTTEGRSGIIAPTLEWKSL